MQSKTSKQQVYFSCCLTFLTTVVSHEIKSSNYQCRNLNRIKLITVVLIEITFSTAILLNNSYISQKIWQSTSFKKVATLNTVTALTVNSIMDIFLQISQNIQNAAAF